jgi:hypothetical protein
VNESFDWFQSSSLEIASNTHSLRHAGSCAVSNKLEQFRKFSLIAIEETMKISLTFEARLTAEI